MRTGRQDIPATLRARVLRFACSVAWLDGVPQAPERRQIALLAERMGAMPPEIVQLGQWLGARPPAVDLELETLAHPERHLFLDVASALEGAQQSSATRAVVAWLTRRIVELSYEDMRRRGLSATA